jgi:hypothetical protein
VGQLVFSSRPCNLSVHQASETFDVFATGAVSVAGLATAFRGFALCWAYGTGPERTSPRTGWIRLWDVLTIPLNSSSGVHPEWTENIECLPGIALGGVASVKAVTSTSLHIKTIS